MIIYIDIDETICHNWGGIPNYELAEPIQKNIDKANKLYDEGHTIIYWTARGASTGIDWRQVTYDQLQEWGVKYHDVLFNKPLYDLFIDDKNMNTKDWV